MTSHQSPVTSRKGLFLLVLVPLVVVLLSSTYTEKWKFLKGSISGVVYNEAGLTVPKAEVVIRGVDYRDTLKTDGQGRFEVKKIPTGVYELRLESSNPALVVRRETAVYLGRETCISLVVKSGASSDVSGAIIGPFYVRDAEGKVIHQEALIGDRSYTVDYTYDSKGRVSFLRDSLNQEWQYEYTPSGKIRKVTRPDKKRIFYNYDREDQLSRIDLPWGYKVFYEKKDDQYIKTVKKFPNLTIYQFVYTLDNKGNKVKVEEGSQKQKGFEYRYDGNNRLKEIWNLKTGEKNSDVLEFKGKIKNGSSRGALEVKNGKYQDKQYEYVFDGRGNIIRQKEKSGGMEVQRIYNGRNLLVREKYLSQSANALTVLYDYDANDRLIMKTIDDRVRYQYYRDQDGHLLHKITRNLLTGEESDGLVYTPFHSEIDQDGLEMIKYEGKEKLLIRDAEGNLRYKVDITDVLKRKVTLLERNVNMDGDNWGETESLLSLISEKAKNPSLKSGEYCRDFYDLPLNDPDISGERIPLVQKTINTTPNMDSKLSPAMEIYVGCYEYQMAAFPSPKIWPSMEDGYCSGEYAFCVDCWEGISAQWIEEQYGVFYDCWSGISGPGELDYEADGYFGLNLNCNGNLQNIGWDGQDAFKEEANGTDFIAAWGSTCIDQTKEVSVNLTVTRELNFGNTDFFIEVVGMEAYTPVDILGPEIIIPPYEPVYSIDISGWDSSDADHSFTSNDTITVYGTALRDGENVSNQIGWEVSGGVSLGGGGPQFSFVPNSAWGGSMSCTITAYLAAGNMSASITINQDNLDELRQEYIDMNRNPVPGRGEFDQDSPYHWKLLDPLDVDAKHQWHILRSINGNAQTSDWWYQVYYGRSGMIDFFSGYRCPSRNAVTTGAAPNSNHQFGKAFDFDQGGNDLATSDDNWHVFQAAISAGALRENSYLLGSDGQRYWGNGYPTMRQLTWQQGHTGWN